MSDPIVTLPPDHWIVKAWEKFCRTPFWKESKVDEAEGWSIFAAGAQCIPGNPEKIAELERALMEVQIDYRQEVLDRNLDEANEQIAVLTQQETVSRQEILQLTDRIKVIERSLAEASDKIREIEKDLRIQISTNFERWRNLDEHVERIRDESNAKHAKTEERLVNPEKAPLVFADTHERAADFARRAGLVKWVAVTRPDEARGVEKTRRFFIDTLTTVESFSAYEEWKNR